MLKNHIRVASRNLIKHKFFSTLNIGGLSVGLTCFMLVLLYWFHETSYESFRKDAERIYRVDIHKNYGGVLSASAEIGQGTAPVLLSDFPEVEEVVRLRETGNWLVKAEDNPETFKLTEAILADTNVFHFFDIPLVYGDPHNSLKNPRTIALNHTTAKKLFGNRNPVGETVVIDNTDSYQVDAVYEDLPSKSHFRHQMMISLPTFKWTSRNYWLSLRFYTYLKLREGASPASVEERFPQMVKKYCAPDVRKFFQVSMEEFEKSGNKINYHLLPLGDVYFKSNETGSLGKTGNIKYLYYFLAVALFILILACVNFINLSTARASNRAKEVGVRKTMGAYRRQIVNQFMAESILTAMVSFVLAIPLTIVALYCYNYVFDIELSVLDLLSPRFVFSMLAITLLAGILAGAYPAFYLSVFKPTEVLKGSFLKGLKRASIINGLVVLQFSISIIMIVGTLVVFDQLSYIQNKQLGYEKDQTFMIHDAWSLWDKLDAFEAEVLKKSSIQHLAYTNFLPVEGTYRTSSHFFKNPSREDVIRFSTTRVGYGFFKAMGIEFISGRPFSKAIASDSLKAIIINETAAKALGYENPLNEKIYQFTSKKDEATMHTYHIIGVVKDFHFNSFKENIKPLFFELNVSKIPKYALIRSHTENLRESLAFV
ncbi:MAG: ABC transporter permease [Bacteroidota bacterium]